MQHILDRIMEMNSTELDKITNVVNVRRDVLQFSRNMAFFVGDRVRYKDSINKRIFSGVVRKINRKNISIFVQEIENTVRIPTDDILGEE